MKRDLHRKLQDLCRRHRVQTLYVFGSMGEKISRLVSGKGMPSIPEGSDLDVGVNPSGGVSLDVRQKVRLGIELEDFFGVNRVDLLVIPEIDPFVAANIVRGERLYCEDEYLADEFELYILRRAGDLIPLEKERMALLLGKGEGR